MLLLVLISWIDRSAAQPSSMDGNNTMHPILVLAGGFGTRLQSVVSDVPKPLAPVSTVPFLQLLVEKWVEQGAQEFVFLLHHKADIVEAFLSSWSRTGKVRNCVFRTLRETQPLGTGGAVAFAVRHLDMSDSFLVANADTWLSYGVVEVSRVPSPAMAVVRVGNANRYGSIRIRQGMVLAVEEKKQTVGKQWINAGLYHLSPNLFQEWDGTPFSLERDLLPRLAGAGRLRAVPLEADFIDIGIPDDYFRFCRWHESGRSEAL